MKAMQAQCAQRTVSDSYGEGVSCNLCWEGKYVTQDREMGSCSTGWRKGDIPFRQEREDCN